MLLEVEVKIEINPRDLMMKETSILGMLGGPRNGKFIYFRFHSFFFVLKIKNAMLIRVILL